MYTSTWDGRSVTEGTVAKSQLGQPPDDRLGPVLCCHSFPSPPHMPLSTRPILCQNSESFASQTNPVEFTAFPFHFIFSSTFVVLHTSGRGPSLSFCLSFFSKISTGRASRLSAHHRSSFPFRTPNICLPCPFFVLFCFLPTFFYSTTYCYLGASDVSSSCPELSS